MDKKLRKISYINAIKNIVNMNKVIIRNKKIICDLYSNADPNFVVKNTDPMHMENLGKKYDVLQKKIRHKLPQLEFNKIANFINEHSGNINNTHHTYNKNNKTITGKLILSAFAFAGYPEFSLDIYRYDCEKKGGDIYTYEYIYDDHSAHSGSEHLVKIPINLTTRGKLYVLSKKIVNGLYEIVNNQSNILWKTIMKLREHIILFQYYQHLYLSIDRQNKIQELMMRWYNEEIQIDLVLENKDIDDKSKKEIISFAKKLQHKTEETLKLIDSGIDKQFLFVYKDTVENVRKKYINFFWDCIDVSFTKGTSESFIKILNEMLEKLKTLIPFKKRDIVYKDLNTLIDVEFCKYQIDSHVFGEEQLKNICDIFIKYMCSVCSSALREKLVIKYKDIIEYDYDNDNVRYKTYLKFILDQLNDISEDIEVVKYALSNGINIFL